MISENSLRRPTLEFCAEFDMKFAARLQRHLNKAEFDVLENQIVDTELVEHLHSQHFDGNGTAPRHVKLF